MKAFLTFILSICLLSNPALAAEQTDFTFYRNPGTPLYGTWQSGVYQFPGNALTASSFRLRGDLVNRPILFAKWIIVWNPNNTSTATSVRLVTADDGPNNIQLLGFAEVSVNNYTTPKVDAVDITYALQEIVANGQYKQIMQQTKGNGLNAPHIYASWIEIVWGDPAP